MALWCRGKVSRVPGALANTLSLIPKVMRYEQRHRQTRVDAAVSQMDRISRLAKAKQGLVLEMREGVLQQASSAQ